MSCLRHHKEGALMGALALCALIALATAVPAAKPDPEAGDGPGSPLLRFRRQASHLGGGGATHKLSAGQLAALGQAEQAAAAEQALIEADEQALKRQLPVSIRLFTTPPPPTWRPAPLAGA